MAYQYLFDPIAANEYEEAFNWCEQKSPISSNVQPTTGNTLVVAGYFVRVTPAPVIQI